jgi:hypothetical protein
VKKQAFVLGAGPAGMFAAHAAFQAGYNPVIFTERHRKSTMFGAQYLHEPIPGLTSSKAMAIQYKMSGSSEGYRSKVYGKSGYTGVVSPELFANRDASAWDIRETYDAAWNAYGSKIISVGRMGMREIARLRESEPAAPIFSSLPLVSICSNRNHVFIEVTVWALGDAPPLGQRVRAECPNMTVICSGLPEDSWYRVSNLYDHKTVEWPLTASYVDGVDPSAAMVHKPLRTTCTCLRTLGIIQVGRYGRWTKGVLSHSAYFDAVEALNDV